MPMSSLHASRRRIMAAAVTVGLATAFVAAGAVSGQAAPAVDCGTHCLSVVGSANLRYADESAPLHYSYTITNRGAARTLASFTITSTSGVDGLNHHVDASVDGKTVPYQDVKILPRKNSMYVTKITLPTAIAGQGGRATLSFVAVAYGVTAARTGLTVTTGSGQSVTAREIVTPYPTIDVAARHVSDRAIPNPSIGNAHRIVMEVPVYSFGTGKTPRASFNFRLGTGWTATRTSGYPGVSCRHAGRTWSCHQRAPVNNSRSYQMISLFPAATAGIHVVRHVHVHIDTIGVTDQIPSNNDVILGVENMGTADTGRTVSVASTSLMVGETTTVTVVVANRGPQPTDGLKVLVLHDGNHTTDHVVLSHPEGPGFFEGYNGAAGPGLEWLPPTIASGHRLTATFTLTARLAGTGYVTVTTNAVTYDPGTAGVAKMSAPIEVS